jgi:glycosyltransferase involved in cell wall biosynthesis
MRKRADYTSAMSDKTAPQVSPSDEVHGTAVTMLLLGSPVLDARVIKTVRSLQNGGYQVTLFCIGSASDDVRLPDLGGGAVRWVTATRPIARLTALSAKLRRRKNEHTAASRDTAPTTVSRSLRRDMRVLFGILWLNLALWRAARHTHAAIVHANDLDTLPAAVLLKRAARARLVYDAHELYPDMIQAVTALYSGLWRLIEHHLIRSVDAVLTVNNALARELQRRHRLTRTPTIVMNCPPFLQLPGRRIPDPELLIIYQGSLNRERGLEDLVRAAPALDPRAILCFRGPGPLRDTLIALSAELGMAARIRFLDPVPPDRQVRDLGQFTVGILPYLPTTLNTYLGTPNKLFEYMMAGVPIVAGDLFEVRDIVLSQGVGVVYPAANLDDLIRAVNRLLASPADLARFSEAGMRAAAGQYNWEVQAGKLLDSYAALGSTHA